MVGTLLLLFTEEVLHTCCPYRGLKVKEVRGVNPSPVNLGDLTNHTQNQVILLIVTTNRRTNRVTLNIDKPTEVKCSIYSSQK